MTDADMVTIRVEHETQGVLFEGSMPRLRAFGRAENYNSGRRRLEFADIGGELLRAKSGPHNITIGPQED